MDRNDAAPAEQPAGPAILLALLLAVLIVYVGVPLTLVYVLS